MRLRVCVLACALTVLGSLVATGLSSAAPRHNHHLTIAATPNPVATGEGVLIYGRLFGADSGSQTITLYQRVIGSGQGYQPAGTASTNPQGYYELNEQGVDTNRDWFVRGPTGSHSRTVHERVIPLLSINASSNSTDTNHPVTFTGHVTPNHPFERVFLQQRQARGDDWRTLRGGFLDANSNYTIAYRWARPGVHDVRVLFRRDARNVRGASDVVTVNIEQAQVPGFTINSSAPIVDSGGSVTISGSLAGTTSPQLVQLWGRHPDQGRFVVIQDGSTDSSGNYSFTQSNLTTNTAYLVTTMRMPHTPRRHTAVLYEGVRDIVTMQANTTSATTDQTVTFSGTVSPNKAGHVIYLQKQGKDGEFHTVEIVTVRSDSTFQFAWILGSPGTHVFRARIPSDERNIGAVSPPVSLTATAPPASTLPPAS
jgi:hypothetical protein